MAKHRIMTFPKSSQSCGSCHSLILRCVSIEKVTQLPVIYRGHGIEKERRLCLNISFVNVVTERAEHRMFHIMLDKFGIFTMTIGGFSFDIYHSLHDGKY